MPREVIAGVLWEVISREAPSSSPALQDSLARQFARLRLHGFELPWTCSMCAHSNASLFGSCEACNAVNGHFSAAVAADVQGASNVSEDHVLLTLARARGAREVEACFFLCEAMVLERSSTEEAIPPYRRAFKLWADLDSNMDMDGVPARLRAEADALFAAAEALSAGEVGVSSPPVFEAVSCAELAQLGGDVGSFLGKPMLEVTKVFAEGDRFPNVVVTMLGTVLVIWGWWSVHARRSEDGGMTWGPEIYIADGIHSGGVTVDETTGDILVFVEDSHPPAPLRMYASTDDGWTWSECEVCVLPDTEGRTPSMHMNEHGITLHRGPHKGRLLRASRWYAGGDDVFEFPRHFTNAVFSDDGGATWQSSAPFPALGTGEAALVELSDGSIYYNSRRHWAPHGKPSLRRWSARSTDGGATWTDLHQVGELPDGPQNDGFGLFGGLARLPLIDRDILIFSNCDSGSGRANGTIWASLDGGKTWPGKRALSRPDFFAYSSLAAGLCGSPAEGWIFCCFEGPAGTGLVARFNLSWIFAGEPRAEP